MTTDDDKDERVSARYRELGRAEPPAQLDDAILAASRRAVHAGPGKQSVRRWALPVSLAAAVMLSVMVTLNVREERPDFESPVYESPVAQPPVAPVAPQPGAPPAAAARSEPRSETAPAPAREVPAAKPKSSAPPSADRRAPRFVPEPPREPASVGATAGAGASAGAAASGQAAAELAAPAPAAAPPAARALSRPAPAELRDRAETMAKRADQAEENAADAETPERMLERIAALRADAKHEEADKLLADFRRRHPQYRIPDAMLPKVLPTR